jgi:hypothetical protein
MSNPIEVAHQAIKAGAGYAGAAASSGMSQARLADILRGRAQMTAHEAARLAAVTGQNAAQLALADPDCQFSFNRNAAL